MIDISLPYISLESDTAFLRIKQWVFRRHPGTPSDIWIAAFFIHALFSIFVLLPAFTQFFRRFLWTKVHRIMGAVYIATVLVISAPSGFIMGLVANGGTVSIISFVTLSVLWWWFTFVAYRAIRKRDYEKHSKFMYRSFALTLSALTLRGWKWLMVNTGFVIWADWNPMQLYVIAGIMGWTINLIVAEVLIHKGRHLKMLQMQGTKGRKQP